MDVYFSKSLIFIMKILLGIAVLGIAILGMSIGIIFGNKSLRGSCNNQPDSCACSHDEKENCKNDRSSKF